MAEKKKKKKKIRSNVKRLKLQQQKHPMRPEKYRKLLKQARRKDFGRRFAQVILIVCVVFLLLFAAGNMYLKKTTGETLFSCARQAREVVEASKPEDFRMSDTSFIFSEDGTKLAELSEDTDATYLEYEDIPTDVVNAFVAVEDRTFWSNSGIDIKGIMRVLIDYVKSRGQSEAGASTITQQFARTEFLTQEKTLIRKIKEIFIARELAKKYSKEQIMEFYCNTCCFANGIYGVEDAAQTYFGKSVKELTLSETAYICAIPNRPEYYNPYRDSKNAVTRRDKILDDMYACGYISESAGVEALGEQIEVVKKSDDDTFYNYEVTYAIHCAVRYLMKQDGFEFRYTYDSEDDYKEYNNLYSEAYERAKHKLYTGGYHVTTTMDLDAQKKLQEILDDNLAFSEKKKKDSDIYELQGAMTVIDNETGKVVAMIGGRSQAETSQTYSLNRGYQSFAQPGSSFKPLAVYTPALNDGYNPGSMLRNINVTRAKKSTSEEISRMSGSQMTMRRAVEKSENGCAYWLFNIIGPKTGLSYVMDMGFTRIVPTDYTMSASLGGLSHGTSTEEMANAYYTLFNHGEYRQTDCISSITDSEGNEIYSEPETKEVYKKEAADNMTDIMMGVLKRGTASDLRWSSLTDTDAAGKTGTTNDNKAGWFCGYTPYYTIAVWVGCDQPKEVANLWGNTYPAYIWKDAMLSMIEGQPKAEFDIEKSYQGYYSQPKKTEKKEDEEKDDEKDEEKEKPTETEKPKETEKPTETKKPTEQEKPMEQEKPAEVGGGQITNPGNSSGNTGAGENTGNSGGNGSDKTSGDSQGTSNPSANPPAGKAAQQNAGTSAPEK